MPASIRPQLDVQLAVKPEVDTYLPACVDCLWHDEPGTEAHARLSAFAHNAEKHPDAIVDYANPREEYAAQTRFIRRRIQVNMTMSIGMYLIGVGFTGLYSGWDVFAMVSLAMFFLNAVMAAHSWGIWLNQLHDHHRHPPGSYTLIVHPPDDWPPS